MHNIPVPPPPQTTAIYKDFKKSTAICKVYNVGLRYIKKYKSFRYNLNKKNFITRSRKVAGKLQNTDLDK